MIDYPRNRERAKDILWAVIRNDNERWLAVFPQGDNSKQKPLGMSVSNVIRETGWSRSVVYRLIDEMLSESTLTRRWSHAHQSYWSGHFNTADEHPVTFTGHEYDDIPF
jgi:hypothetical protein